METSHAVDYVSALILNRSEVLALPLLRASLAQWLPAELHKLLPVVGHLLGVFGQEDQARAEDVSRVAAMYTLAVYAASHLDSALDDAEKDSKAWRYLSHSHSRLRQSATLLLVVPAIGLEGSARCQMTVPVMLRALQDSSAGQILALEGVQTARDYERVAELKTARLVAGLFDALSMVLEVPAQPRDCLVAFGRQAGLALQTNNDIRGVWDADGTVRRDAGSDLLTGRMTTPLFYLAADPEVARLLARVAAGTATVAEREALYQHAARPDVLEHTQARLVVQWRAARAALSGSVPAATRRYLMMWFARSFMHGIDPKA